MAGDSTQSGTPDLATASRARRSTRILEAVRLKIVGESRIGTAQLELTSAVAVSCHGCLYLSRHEHQRDSWMTLEVSNQHTGPKSPPVRAKVRFVRLPGNPRELYGVGVELETPANIWGIKSVPEDWLPYFARLQRVRGIRTGLVQLGTGSLGPWPEQEPECGKPARRTDSCLGKETARGGRAGRGIGRGFSRQNGGKRSRECH